MTHDTAAALLTRYFRSPEELDFSTRETCRQLLNLILGNLGQEAVETIRGEPEAHLPRLREVLGEMAKDPVGRQLVASLSRAGDGAGPAPPAGSRPVQQSNVYGSNFGFSGGDNRGAFRDNRGAIGDNRGAIFIQGPAAAAPSIPSAAAASAPTPAPSLPAAGEAPIAPVRILFLAANPGGTESLRLDQEIRAIEEALQGARFRDRFELLSGWAVRPADLQRHLLQHEPAIVQFSGHGEVEGILLEGATGTSQEVGGEILARVFAPFADAVRCVVLNACYSESQAAAIAEHIDCVVGMSQWIGDEAARCFSTAFYRALAFGKDLATAFDMGCTAIALAGPREEATPRLICLRGEAAEIRFVTPA